FSVGDLAMFVYFLNVAQEITRDFGSGFAGYRQQGVSFGRMHDLMAGAPPMALVWHDEIPERGPLPSGAPGACGAAHEALRSLRLEGLSYEHGLNDVSLVLDRGSFTVVTGRVGSGKTTLLRAVLGLVPASGRIWWNDAPVDDPASLLAPPRTA